MNNVLDLHRRKIESGLIKLETRFEQPDEIRAFPGEMRQVFSNLLGNAIEATAAGGKIAVHVRPWREVSGARRQGVRVTVADTGSGISPQVRSHIFEPFFTTKGEKGTGLGLWVSQGIVAKHGGRIRLHSSTSAERHGTTFTIFLPEKPEDPRRSENGAAS
jgi:two-component system, NtrC family, sensor kinase